jgi:hypothetical protein
MLHFTQGYHEYESTTRSTFGLVADEKLHLTSDYQGTITAFLMKTFLDLDL